MVTQRAWRAACPNCGAPVEFASAASASAVCGFCRSTLLRDGEALKRIGVSAELFDDHSPLQLGASGRHMGSAFTIVGRQQIGYEGGSWNEWHVLFDGGADSAGGLRSGWLSEDNGAYVVAFDAPLTGEVPRPEELHPGEQRLVGGAIWSVASVVRAKVLAAEGELPTPPRVDGAEFAIADLRNTVGEVATLDWRDPQQVGWSVGRAVALSELKMAGLREESEKTLKGRAIECPSCGASLEPKLSTTQSIVCGQCKAVVDVSKGVGGELQHFAQDNAGAQPLIPLGRSGTLALGAAAKPLSWQVVGYVERCEVDVDPGEEQTAWREYLLYHRESGFSFLVDAEDGWSYATPITGVPQVKGDRATWQGTTYSKLYGYTGAVTYVLGEFYWRLQRGERTKNIDFAAGPKRLNREQAGSEVTWSAGEALDSAAVAKAFGLADEQAQAMRRDVSPLSGDAGGLVRRLATYLVIGAIVLIVILMLSRCGSDNCDSVKSTFGEASAEYQQCLRSSGSSGSRTGGGSFGGFSSGGGGHK
jgi:ribosomal protein S27AE